MLGITTAIGNFKKVETINSRIRKISFQRPFKMFILVTSGPEMIDLPADFCKKYHVSFAIFPTNTLFKNFRKTDVLKFEQALNST